uniref:Kinesin-like KIF1-type domain-containing protein n=1 Tax=Lutzomyia longipalpis TaxID=7200 RepID=A0A1B0CVG8_LUTLO
MGTGFSGGIITSSGSIAQRRHRWGFSSVASEPQTPAQPIDYNFAREELMQNELSNDPIQTAIAQLERQHEEDKQVALEKQRQEYEKQFQQLRNILSPTTPYAPYAPYDPIRMGKITPCTPTTQMRMEKWAQERDEMFRRSLGQLKTDIMRANALVQEANVLAEEMEKKTKFSVTLQIPPANLSPNRRRGAFVSEPAILVRRMNQGSQIWSMEKLENKLIDMREMYQESRIDESKKAMDPFYESQENHNLIGVANIFLEVLFHDVKLDYHTPIISQQGEVAGRLQVEVTRIAGQMPQDRMCETGSDNSSEGSRDDEYGCDGVSNQITCRAALGQLKTDIMRANALVQEANVLAEEMEKKTKFSVTLQIPPANLSPNRRRGAFVSEPAILVRRMNQGSQIWSMEKLENKLIDMREMYQEFKDRPMAMDESKKAMDPFYESQENHNLIGVANIFLEVLFHDVKLDYHTPIISQQGEVAGRLQVEVTRIAGQMPQDRMCETGSDNSSEGSRDDEYGCDGVSNQITCRVSIKQATGLPISLSNYVFCQYTFWGHQETVVPVVNSELISHNENNIYKFEHVQDYTVQVSEEFLEHAAEGALSIEVWGHRSMGFSQSKEWEVEHKEAKARSLVDRWAELSRKIELWVEIHELNDNGEYTPVEVSNRNEVLTVVRQGQQRRIQVRVKPVQNSGTLPIICQSILSIAVGSVTVRSRLQKPLDSYQEEDLTVLRDKWNQKLINKDDKSDEEKERELSLVHQWVSLTEERNAVLVPAPGSGIPGAPASWDPSPGMEPHVPVLFLDLNADDLTTQNATDELSVVGLNSILPKEHGNKFYTLQLLQHLDKDICAIASWDSSMHDSQSLNRVTE